jgi:hypothetical protein
MKHDRERNHVGMGSKAMQAEIDRLNERVAWLERKMVRVLWLLVSATSAGVAGVVTYNIDKSFGWPSVLVGVGIWLALGLILQRMEFKGAPAHIQFIDP